MLSYYAFHKKEKINELHQIIPDLYLIMIPLLESFIFKNARREINILSLDPEDYYKKLLNDKPHYIEQIPLKYLASYLGVTPETLSRIRTRISKEKIPQTPI